MQSKLSIQVLTFIAFALFLVMPFAVLSGSVGVELVLLLAIQILLTVVVAARLGDLLNPIVFTLAAWTYLYAFQPLIYVYAGDIVANPLSPDEAVLVARFSTVAAVLMVAGYFIPFIWRSATALLPNRTFLFRPWNDGRALLIFLVAYALIWLNRLVSLFEGGFFHVPLEDAAGSLTFYRVSNYIFSSGATGNGIFVVAILGVLAAFRPSRKIYGLLFTVLVVETAVSLISGWRSFLPLAAVSALFIYNNARTSIRMSRLVGVAVLVAVVMFPIRQIIFAYRLNTADIAAQPSVETVTFYMRSALESFLDATADPTSYMELTYSSLLVLDAPNNLAAMLNAVPKYLDYDLGRTIILPVVRYPLEIFGASRDTILDTNVHNLVARRFGLTSPYEYTVNVTVPVHGELYINFGLVGVAFGMCLLGGIYRAITMYFSPIRSESGCFLHFIVWYFWVLLGTYLSLGTLISHTVIKLLIFTGVLYLLVLPGNKDVRNSWSGSSAFENR